MEKAEALLQSYAKGQQFWERFRQTTKKNIETIESKQRESEQKLKDVEETEATIKLLSKHARARSYVKLSPLCHIFATIKHTGEYNVHYDNNYQAVLTAQQTIEYLERKKKDIKVDLDIYDNQIVQLMKRLNVEEGIPEMDLENAPPPEMDDMPDKIQSDVGIAVKNSGFYEIIEVDDSTPFVPTKERKRISRLKSKTNAT